ncbi:MAG: GNAT family N-acetyltransferase [Pseudomonadota bacterium]
MEIRPFEPRDTANVYRLLITNGWRHRIASEHYLQELVTASQLTVVAVDESQIVGFARAITDGLSNGYLSMVVVDEACRGRGVGTQLVERIIGGEPNVSWVLRAGRTGAQKFFSRLGFKASTEAMERVRQPAAE